MVMFIRGVLLAVLVAAGLFQGTCPGQGMPSEPLVLRLEALEAFEDGLYHETIRLCGLVRKWVNTPGNAKQLSSNNVSWLAILGLTNVLEARAYFELGDLKTARNKARLAAAQMEQRRKYFVGKGASPQEAINFWLIESKLKFLEGDLDRPVADYGVSAWASQPIGVLATRLGDPRRAKARYDDAQRVLEMILKVEPDIMNARVNAREQDAFEEDVGLEVNSQMIRLLVNAAVVRLRHKGEPTDADLADADSYLVRAEELLWKNPWWELFVAPIAKFGGIQISYYHLQELADEKRKKLAESKSDLTENDIIELKRLWGRAIDDYLRVMCARAEAAAYVELRSSGDAAIGDSPTSRRYRLANAERIYDRCVNLLRQQYAPDHVKVLRARMSKARWLVVISGPDRVRDMTSDVQVRRTASVVRDALLLIHEQRLFAPVDAVPQSREAVELDFAELCALNNLKGLHSKRSCLSDAQLAEVEARSAVLTRSLAAIVDPSGAGEEPE